MRPKIISCGDDYRDWPRELWGWRDHERERARLEVEARKPLPKSFEPLPVESVKLGFTSLHSEPRPPLEPRDPDAAWVKAWYGRR